MLSPLSDHERHLCSVPYSDSNNDMRRVKIRSIKTWIRHRMVLVCVKLSKLH